MEVCLILASLIKRAPHHMSGWKPFFSDKVDPSIYESDLFQPSPINYAMGNKPFDIIWRVYTNYFWRNWGCFVAMGLLHYIHIPNSHYIISHKMFGLIPNDGCFQPISIHDLPSPHLTDPENSPVSRRKKPSNF
jgi:hypothetical protein